MNTGTMHHHALPVIQPGTVLFNPLIKDRVTMVATAASTAGVCTHLRIELAPSGGNAMHTHSTFTETFTAREGVLGVHVNGERKTLAPGQRAVVPMHAKHCFFNPSNAHSVVFDVELRPANAGFERSLIMLYGLAQEGLAKEGGGPRSLLHLALLVHWSDTEPTGPMRMLLPLLRLVGRRLANKPRYQAMLEGYVKHYSVAPKVAEKEVEAADRH